MQEQLSVEQVETLKARYEQNIKSVNQTVRLRAFFKAPFKHTVLGWKTDKSKRLTAEEAEEKLRKLVRDLREEASTLINSDIFSPFVFISLSFNVYSI